MPDLGISGMEFENIFVMFQINVLEFVLLQSLVQKWKSLNLGPKMLDMDIFWLELENNIVILEISTLELV